MTALKKLRKKLNTVLLRTLLSLLAVMQLLGGIKRPEAAAWTPPDPSRGTELTVELAYDGMLLPGGNFSLYRVGSIDENAQLSLDAAYSDFSISDPKSRSDWDVLARQMAAFCREKRIQPLKTGKTDAGGRVRFGSGAQLASGLYLVVGDDLVYRDYRYSSLPFLVSLPNWNTETGSWDYAVLASPKVDRKPEVQPTPTPTPTPTPGPGSGPKPTLPQTGMLWWPIPPLFLFGVALLVLGLLRKRKAEGKKNKAPATVAAGLLCALAAVGLLLYNMWDDARADLQATEEKEQLIAAVLPEDGTFPAHAAIQLAAEEKKQQVYLDMPVKEIDGAAYAAILSIPSLNLELPIRYEWSYDALKQSPCRYVGSAYMDDLVLCAHNYSQHFGRIKDLEPDSEILLVDMEGNLFRYRVVLTETLQPTEVDKMVDSEYDLSLFTCTLGGQTRVTVRCQKE